MNPVTAQSQQPPSAIDSNLPTMNGNSSSDRSCYTNSYGSPSRAPMTAHRGIPPLPQVSFNRAHHPHSNNNSTVPRNDIGIANWSGTSHTHQSLRAVASDDVIPGSSQSSFNPSYSVYNQGGPPVAHQSASRQQRMFLTQDNLNHAPTSFPSTVSRGSPRDPGWPFAPSVSDYSARSAQCLPTYEDSSQSNQMAVQQLQPAPPTQHPPSVLYPDISPSQSIYDLKAAGAHVASPSRKRNQSLSSIFELQSTNSPGHGMTMSGGGPQMSSPHRNSLEAVPGRNSFLSGTPQDRAHEPRLHFNPHQSPRMVGQQAQNAPANIHQHTPIGGHMNMQPSTSLPAMQHRSSLPSSTAPNSANHTLVVIDSEHTPRVTAPSAYSPMADVTSPNSSSPWPSPHSTPISHIRNSPSRQNLLANLQQGRGHHRSSMPAYIPSTQCHLYRSMNEQQQQPHHHLHHLHHHHQQQQQVQQVQHSQQQPRLQHQQHQQRLQPESSALNFIRVRSMSDLPPPIMPSPQLRRAKPEGGFISPLSALTINIASTYSICNPSFQYQSSRNPRRVLTKPSEPQLNNGYDNCDSDYILYVNDTLGIDEQRRYVVLDVLGQGTFGQVVKCQNLLNKEIVAVKVIKNKRAYYNQSMVEVCVLQHLNNTVDQHDQHNLLRLKDTFIHKKHLCLVFELLSSNLYELIKQNEFRGLSTSLVRVFVQQLLDSLCVLKEARLIHCDLKPENILLKSLESPQIKVIDFGSACHERQTIYSYIQSRFYRSPEVILSLSYSSSIDMWSLGCIVAELFLGLPIFPGTSEYDQLSRIIDTLGMPPKWMIELGKNSSQFMERVAGDSDQGEGVRYRLKSREKYSRQYNTNEQPSKQYFTSKDLSEIIMNYPVQGRSMRPSDVEKEMANRESLLDFIKGLLNLNPLERWTPQQARQHPFVTGAEYTGPFKPTLPRESLSTHTPQPQGMPIDNAGSAAERESAAPISAPFEFVNPPPQVYQPLDRDGMPVAISLANQARARPRATTIGSLDPVPAPIQRATANINNREPIRAQPSPAYIPPPELLQANRSESENRAAPYGQMARNLEEGLLRRAVNG